MPGQAKSGLHLMVRGRILILFGACTFLLIATAAFGASAPRTVDRALRRQRMDSLRAGTDLRSTSFLPGVVASSELAAMRLKQPVRLLIYLVLPALRVAFNSPKKTVGRTLNAWAS